MLHYADHSTYCRHGIYPKTCCVSYSPQPADPRRLPQTRASRSLGASTPRPFGHNALAFAAGLQLLTEASQSYFGYIPCRQYCLLMMHRKAFTYCVGNAHRRTLWQSTRIRRPQRLGNVAYFWKCTMPVVRDMICIWEHPLAV